MECTKDRKSVLIHEVGRAAHALQQQQRIDLQATLSGLLADAVRLLPPAQHAGITLTSGDSVRTAAATGRCSSLLDQIQERFCEGPGLSAARDQQTVRVKDVACETRWPAFCRAALRDTPIRSILSLELSVESAFRGALSLYAEQTDAFGEESEHLGAIYAVYAGMAWAFARRNQQFHQALATRDTIGQAKGIIMQRFSVDAENAFRLLKRLSQSSNTPLVQVATKLVATELEQADPCKKVAI